LTTQLSLNSFTTPRRNSLVDDLRHSPILIPGFDCPHSSFRCCPCGFDHVCLSTRCWLGRGCTNDESFGVDGCEPINVRSKVDFDDVVLGEFEGSGGVGANNGES
jgi:hypothetical protein